MSDRVFDDNQSSWLIGAPPDEPSAPLARDLDVDVAIIGGGFTGVSAAYHLSKRNPKLGIALLEATRLGNGATGRNGGLVLNGITVRDVDPDLMVKEQAITRAAIDSIEVLIREHALPVRFRRDGCVHICTTRESAEEAHRRTEQLVARGSPLRYLTTSELRGRLAVEGVHGAVIDPTEAQLAGVDLVRAMRPVLLAQGVQIFEGTRVTKIREGATIELETVGHPFPASSSAASGSAASGSAASSSAASIGASSHVVRAKAIVLATSGYTSRLGYFRSGLLPVISHVIATDPLPADLLERTGLQRLAGFFDDLPRLGYCSVDSDRRLVFGGGSTAAYSYRFGNATTYDAKLGDPATTALRETLVRYLPELADVPIKHRWSGPLDLTLPRHCAIGVTGAHSNIYYGVGYSGHGITLANLAGRVIADLHAGNHDAWKDVAFYKLKPGGIPPEPFRWLGYHAYTKLTGRSPWKRPE